MAEHESAAIDLEAGLLFQLFSDVSSGHGTVQTAGLAGIGLEEQTLAIDNRGLGFGVGAHLCPPANAGLTDLFGLLERTLAGQDCIAAGNQVVSCKAAGHGIDIAGQAEFRNILNQ